MNESTGSLKRTLSGNWGKKISAFAAHHLTKTMDSELQSNVKMVSITQPSASGGTISLRKESGGGTEFKIPNNESKRAKRRKKTKSLTSLPGRGSNSPPDIVRGANGEGSPKAKRRPKADDKSSPSSAAHSKMEYSPLKRAQSARFSNDSKSSNSGSKKGKNSDKNGNGEIVVTRNGQYDTEGDLMSQTPICIPKQQSAGGNAEKANDGPDNNNNNTPKRKNGPTASQPQSGSAEKSSVEKRRKKSNNNQMTNNNGSFSNDGHQADDSRGSIKPTIQDNLASSFPHPLSNGVVHCSSSLPSLNGSAATDLLLLPDGEYINSETSLSSSSSSSKKKKTTLNNNNESPSYNNRSRNINSSSSSHKPESSPGKHDDTKQQQTKQKRNNSKKNKRLQQQQQQRAEEKKKRNKGAKNNNVEDEDEDSDRSDTSSSDDSNQSATLLMFDSLEASRSIFDWLISPMSPKDFFKDSWEKRPVHIRRDSTEMYQGIFSTQEMARIFREKDLEFDRSLDITMYVDGKRQTVNPKGKVYAPTVWDSYNQGCSIRLRDPIAHSDTVWRFCSLMQETFSSFSGANVYLTPPGTQGFAPHWDDIDAFMLQLEGTKHWRVYEPREKDEVLPRESSENFDESDLPRKPVIDTWLKPGDLLYVPRGWIHQGNCPDDQHSLHLTVSVGYKNTWADLLEKTMPSAMELLAQSDVKFRHSLPVDYLNTMGVTNDPEDGPVSSGRKRFLREYRARLDALVEKAMELADSAADQMAKEFIHGSLPPVLTENEQVCSVACGGEVWDNELNQVDRVTELMPNTNVKLIRRHILRLCEEGEPAEQDCVRVYYAMANTRNYKERDALYFDVPTRVAAGIDYLLQSYPDYVPVEEIADEEMDQSQQMELCEMLYAKCLLITEEPLDPTYDFEED